MLAIYNASSRARIQPASGHQGIALGRDHHPDRPYDHPNVRAITTDARSYLNDTDQAYDLIWFGLVMLLGLEISLTTPPFGLLLFVMVGVAPEGTKLGHAAVSAAPYIGCAILLLVMLIIWPDIALYLPSLIET